MSDYNIGYEDGLEYGKELGYRRAQFEYGIEMLIKDEWIPGGTAKTLNELAMRCFLIGVGTNSGNLIDEDESAKCEGIRVKLLEEYKVE